MSLLANAEELEKLLLELKQQQKRPPIHTWQPPSTGHSKMTIRRDGSWWHDGGEIKRLALRQLFAQILRKEEDGQYYLVTPVEKQTVTVEDSPFLITEVIQIPAAENERFPRLVFVTNMAEKVILSDEHPLWFETAKNGDEVPYVLVREGLSARIPTEVYYQCVALLREIKKEDDTTEWWLVSGDYAVCLGAM